MRLGPSGRARSESSLCRGSRARGATIAGLGRWRVELIAPGQLAFLLWNPRIDNAKAQRELGFVPTPLEDGVRNTLVFLRAEGLVRR